MSLPFTAFGTFFDFFLVDLEHMDCHAACRRQLLMAHVAFEMLGFLVLDQDFFIVKLTSAIPTKRLLLLPPLSRHV